jgi:hypothetical protein
VIGLEFECNHCQTRYSVPVRKLDRLAMACPNCREQWLDHRPGPKINESQTVLNNFTECLKVLQQSQLEGVVLRLEIYDNS